MLTVEEALDAVLSRVRVNPTAQLPLTRCPGHVLAEDVLADIDNPPFDNSAVDGYAVRAADTAGASPDCPAVLQPLPEVMAGSVPGTAVAPGLCMKAMTGAPMPAGADAMVMVEDARDTGEGVLILAEAAPGDHVRRRGADVHTGETVLTAGTLIHAAEIAMLAAVGKSEIAVARKPRVAVLSTGDELVDVSTRPGPGQIRDSNRYALAALVEEAGAELHSMVHIPDDLTETEEALRKAAGQDGSEPADVIVTSGGVSVGDRDYVKPALEKIGTMDLWRVSMKPGKPLAFGRIGETLFFGLPGNPVSTMVTFELFVRPALWKMAGRTNLHRTRVRAVLDDDVSHNPGRREYVRAVVRLTGDQFIATPTGAQGSGVLTSMLGANALLVLPEDVDGVRAGETVDALLLSSPATADDSSLSGGRA
jgi:molybdopterin molybdotransferase